MVDFVIDAVILVLGEVLPWFWVDGANIIRLFQEVPLSIEVGVGFAGNLVLRPLFHLLTEQLPDSGGKGLEQMLFFDVVQ